MTKLKNKLIKNKIIKKIYKNIYGKSIKEDYYDEDMSVNELCNILRETYEKACEEAYNNGEEIGYNNAAEENERDDDYYEDLEYKYKYIIEKIHNNIFDTTCEIKTIEELCQKIKKEFENKYNKGFKSGSYHRS